MRPDGRRLYDARMRGNFAKKAIVSRWATSIARTLLHAIAALAVTARHSGSQFGSEAGMTRCILTLSSRWIQLVRTKLPILAG